MILEEQQFLEGRILEHNEEVAADLLQVDA